MKSRSYWNSNTLATIVDNSKRVCDNLVISLYNTKKLIENTQLVYTAPYTYTRPMLTRPPGSRAGDIPDVHTNTTFSFFLRLQTYYLSTTISVTNVL